MIPINWKVKNFGNDGLYFGRQKENDIGGVYRQEFNVNFKAGEKSLPNIDNLLHWMIPNHTDVTKTEKLNGFFTDTYLMNLTTYNSLSEGGNATGTWTYIFLIDKNASTAYKFVAYEIFLNRKYVTELDAIKIARGFKII